MNHPDRPAGRALSEAEKEAEAARLIAEGYSDNAPVATFYKDVSPVPPTGYAPPVAQHGRAPMSQRATDVSGIMLAAGVASVPICGGISLVMWTVGQVNPVVVGIVFVAPIVFLGALSRVFKGAKEVVAAAPPEIHKHFEGDVHMDNSTHSTKTVGLIAQTKNDNRRR
ncbi:hypothetical protein [Streptomyces ureilyticus]|uniref:Uncharacterized protein n=1 Tax=Streptomyces ureilyticus TaxID=1775131 RepID=A0ABX0DJT9_9ACTN|nr:hypothetical protein [Streptomyces ureilyticus]NGO40674.1 hypothetical protein [Streptomyces ureilyticus]